MEHGCHESQRGLFRHPGQALTTPSHASVVFRLSNGLFHGQSRVGRDRNAGDAAIDEEGWILIGEIGRCLTANADFQAFGIEFGNDVSDHGFHGR